MTSGDETSTNGNVPSHVEPAGASEIDTLRQQFIGKYVNDNDSNMKSLEDILGGSKESDIQKLFGDFSRGFVPKPNNESQLIEKALESGNGKVLKDAFQKVTCDLTPNERESIVTMKKNGIKTRNPNITFLLENFFVSDITKLCKGSALTNQRMEKLKKMWLVKKE